MAPIEYLMSDVRQKVQVLRQFCLGLDSNGRLLTTRITQGILRDMRTAAPPLLPIFRSQLQGELLAAALLQPERSESLTDIARRLRADVGTVQREVSRLERAGILRTHRVGNTRLVSADTASPLYDALATVVLRSFGPDRVIAAEFASVDGVDVIYIFGSWAARFVGEEGPPPVDVDVLILGDPNRDEVHDAALRAEHRLGRQVNVTIRSAAVWASADDGFVRQVRSSPVIEVSGASSFVAAI